MLGKYGASNPKTDICAVWKLSLTQDVRTLNVLHDKISIKQVTVRTFDGASKDFGSSGTVIVSNDSLLFETMIPMVGLYGFIGINGNWKGLSAL